MSELIDRIKSLNRTQLQEVMQAVEARYAEVYPQWDVVYIAMHKDPSLRIQEYANLLDMIGADLQGMADYKKERLG